jgi:hypothetical protein
MTDEKQPFFSHLKELRDRLLVCIVAVAIAFIFTYYFKERLFDFLMQPFLKVMPAQSSFIFTGITEAFLTYFKIRLSIHLFRESVLHLWRLVLLLCCHAEHVSFFCQLRTRICHSHAGFEKLHGPHFKASHHLWIYF